MEVLESKIKPFVDATREAIIDGNYYASLTLALTLPDICSKLQFPKEYTGVRYPNWFNKYVKEKYTKFFGDEEHVFLSGKDSYALRCSLLHQGETDITGQKAKEMLTDFIFVAPKDGSLMHNLQSNTGTSNVLLLQVDIYCEDICQGVEKWVEEYKNNQEVIQRASNLLSIQSMEGGISF